MKTIKISKFESFDGKMFDDQKECEHYELDKFNQQKLIRTLSDQSLIKYIQSILTNTISNISKTANGNTEFTRALGVVYDTFNSMIIAQSNLIDLRIPEIIFDHNKTQIKFCPKGWDGSEESKYEIFVDGVMLNSGTNITELFSV